MARHLATVQCLIVSCVALWSWGQGAAADTPRHRLSTFECDVTLPLGDLLYAEPLVTIEHPLLAKGVVLEEGGKRFVLCAVDWCTMRNLTHAMFQSKIAEAAGTEPKYVAVHCVHQHTAPSFDATAERLLQEQPNPPAHRNLTSLEAITDRLAASVREAIGRLEPFDSVGISEVAVARVASIRRVFTPEGKLLTRWSACRDEALRTVSLGRGGKALVRLHYYATHPQTYYRDGRASYDFPGMARQRVQQEEGVFQVYFTGCAGDVTAGKYNDGTPEARAELAERLYQAMKACAGATRWAPVGPIVWRSEGVLLQARTEGNRDPDTCRATLADPNQKPEARIEAAGRLACFHRLQEPVEISTLQIGPARILHLPGEPMIAYQHFACGLVPGQFVAVAGYGLGTTGYVCTERAFAEGGYEPSASAIVPDSEWAIRAAIRRLLDGPADPFAPENLMAWCIVPFDAKNRGPEERAQMLQRLGIRRLAYDWRAEHVSTFDQEVETMQRHGIEIVAWWFPDTLDDTAKNILDVLRRHAVRAQLWVSLRPPAPQTQDPADRIKAAADAIRPIALEAAKIGCQVGLYNHGGWFGEPENQIAILRQLNLDNVGMVYNFHHGHAHIDRFAALMLQMRPYLLAINLNGMVQGGDQTGKKILTLGEGDQELQMLRTILQSGWYGPVGILDHRPETDSEVTLQANLEGLKRLRQRLGLAP